METIFSVPMRNNNNNLLESGQQLVSDWIDPSLINVVHVRFDVESMDAGTEIVLSYTIRNGGFIVAYGNGSITTSIKTHFGFMRGDLDNTTTVEGTVQTFGRSRYSFDIVAFEVGEDVPEWDDPLPG